MLGYRVVLPLQKQGCCIVVMPPASQPGLCKVAPSQGNGCSDLVGDLFNM